MRLERAGPVVQVSDVGRSIDWYVAMFGVEADPFPKNPPHGFAILRRDGVELMLQAGTSLRTAQAEEEGCGPVPADANVPTHRECVETAP